MQVRQKAANTMVYVARKTFDRLTSYNLEAMNERKWLRRILFLETIAGRHCFLAANMPPICQKIHHNRVR